MQFVGVGAGFYAGVDLKVAGLLGPESRRSLNPHSQPSEEKAYPSASGNAECCGDVGEFVVEQIANLLTVHGRYDRLSPLLDRVPTAFRRRGCLRSVSYRAALA